MVLNYDEICLKVVIFIAYLLVKNGVQMYINLVVSDEKMSEKQHLLS